MDNLSSAASAACQAGSSCLSGAVNFTREHPYLVGLPVAVGAVAAATPGVILPAVGFTNVGPAAGSLAASVQSACYAASVPAGSLFSSLQSVAMGGTAIPAAKTAAYAAAPAAVKMASSLYQKAFSGQQDGNAESSLKPDMK